MRILLIDPPFKIFTGFVNYYFPMGLAYLAASLRAAGHEAAIFEADAIKKGNDIDFSDEYKRLELYRQGLCDDNHQAWKEIEKVIRKYKPHIIGITAMTTKLGSALKTAEVIRKIRPDMSVIAGGPHATLQPGQMLKCRDIDILVRGEGEQTLVELAEVFTKYFTAGSGKIKYPSDTKIQAELKKIDGISFKVGKRIIHNPDRRFIPQLDALPFPDRLSLMNISNYTSEDMGAIMASRGCPFDCAYCCHPWGRKVRYRTVENVISEMKEVTAKFKTRQFEFKDDSFTVNKKWVLDFCEKLIKEKMKINWGCTTRADILDDELVNNMKRAGCNAVKIGIETGSERILKETDKGVTFGQMKKAADLLNKHKVFWSGYFMAGLPNETKDDILMTCSMLKKLNPYYAGLGIYNPFPNTRLFDLGTKKGLLYPNVDLDHFFKTNPKDYYFKNPDVRIKDISKQEFDELLSYMTGIFHKHNTKLNNILRRAWARRRTYIRDYKILLGDIKKALKWIRK